MERFAIKIDKNLRANLYKICRLCGIDNPDKVKVLDDATIVNLEEGEPELWKKVLDCIGLLITKDDKMPQFMCTLCVDKINDFFEFREMCYATDIQTRKLLGIKEEPKPKVSTKIQNSSTECKVEAQDVKQPVAVVPAQKPGRKRRNADMEICGTLKDIKTDDVKDIKTSGASTSLSSAKKKRLKLETTDVDSKSSIDTKVEPTKTGASAKLAPASKIGLTKKRLKIEPNIKNKKELRQPKSSKLIKSKLKVETPSATEDRKSTPLQLKKKKALEVLKQRKLAKQIAVVKVEKMRKASIDAKIKEETPQPAVTSVPNQPKVKLKEACKICSDSYVNKILLAKHIKTTHIPVIARYHCVHCNETLKKNMEIKNHNLWHKLSKTPFQCGNCSESSCSIYTYTKHIRDCGQVSYIDAQVPDWHCPECQGVFQTTYLFNIHSCVSNTLVCPGCDKSHKWKEDYFKHIPTCAAAVHRIPAYMTPHIQVKNEAEHPSSPIPQNHAQSLPSAAVVTPAQPTQVSRITPPLMDSNQCVVIPGNVGLLEEAPSSSPKGSCKKSKRITKKDLKRFDKLLKSTMTTLVSIKQEPTQSEMSVDRELSGSLEMRSNVSESPSASPEPTDDHFYNDDDSVDEQSFAPTVSTIKQEIVDEGYRDLYSNIEVNVKRELTDNETMKMKTCDAAMTTPPPDSQPPKPVLKLKITKEHGTLNSILLDSPKSEKKKKKKKRKDEKHREREEPENVQREQTKTKVAAEVTKNLEMEPSMPIPEIVRVKEELPEAEEERESMKEQVSNDAAHCVPSIVAATSGSLQISCVSEGVNFNGADENEIHTEEEHPDAVLAHESSEMECIPPCSEPHEAIDIKPRLEDLIPTLQIASVSSGAETILHPIKRKRGRPPGSKKASTSTPKILSVSSGIEVAPFEPELGLAAKGGEEACEKMDSNENVFDYTQVKVKEEIVDPAFEEQDSQAAQNEIEPSTDEAHTEKPIFDKEAEESAYIANIDFNNLSIKQEKEYIDEGLDNPVAFEDDDESDTDSESSSDSDSDDSDSDREYRELPSENEETTTSAMSNTVMHPVGLQISEVRSEFTCQQPTQKTESQKGVEHSSEGTTKSNAATECCEILDIPNPDSHLSVADNSSCGEQQDAKTSSISHEEKAPEQSSSPPHSIFPGTSPTDKNESEYAPEESSSIASDPSATGASKIDETEKCPDLPEQHPLFAEMDDNFIPELCEADISKGTVFDSLPETTVTDTDFDKSLKDQLQASFNNPNANTLELYAEKSVHLGNIGVADTIQRKLLPLVDNFSPAEVNFTVMPVESLCKIEVQDATSGASASNEDDNTKLEPSPKCSLTQPDEAETPTNAGSLVEEINIENPLPETATAGESGGLQNESTSISALDFPLPVMSDINLESTLGETSDFTDVSIPLVKSIPESNQTSITESSLEPSTSKASTSPITSQQNPSKMYDKTDEALAETSQSSPHLNSQDIIVNPERDQSTDENFLETNAIDASHIEQQEMLLEPPTSDSLTLHLPSFNETHSASSQLFDTTIGLDSHYSSELDRQNLDASVSIDLSEVLSSATLNAPSAVAVLPPHPSSHFTQSADNVSETPIGIPFHSSIQPHLSSDANFLETNLNFTELCRANASLSSLSDFHINAPTAGHLHNLMSSTDAHSSQLLSDLSGIASSSTNNTDLNVPVLSEEVQNLLNEDSVAASNFELNDSILRARCSSSMNAFSPSAPVAVSVPNFTDLENVNEIAENNNNANLERELQDELGNALAAAIADRSPNDDEVDENNAINENRANFDLT